MKSFVFSLVALCSFVIMQAQSIPDWSTSVAPILYQHCTPCHHGGGSGHGNFVDYDSAKAFAGSIGFYASVGYMPPWPPDTSRRFAHERRLSQAEINTLQSWMLNGTPKGDTSLAPPKPVYNNNAQLSTPPDAIFAMPTFSIPSGGSNDVYWNIVIPTNTLQNQFIRGFEFIPGNAAAVHHALVFIDTGTTVLNNDAAYPGIGYPGFGGVGSNTANLLGAYVPGSSPFLLPAGFGYRFPANSYLVFNMHYPASAVGQTDSSKINVYYANGSVREVFIKPVLNHVSTLLNGPLSIPANQTRNFVERYTLPNVNVSVFGIAPHMHLIGRSIRSYAIAPGSSDTLPLIRIPEWNFKWQGAYYFQKIQKVLGNTKLYAEAYYDNTISNPLNPNNPPQTVNAGENTNDEMMLVYFIYTPYVTGDEHIILDSTLLVNGLPNPEQNPYGFKVYPNPLNDQLTCAWTNHNPGSKVTWCIANSLGQTLETGEFPVSAVQGQYRLSLAHYPKGVYAIRLRTNRNQWSTLIQKE